MEVTEKQIIWTKPAISDLKEINDYYTKFSKKVADKIVSELTNKPKELLVTGFENAYQFDDINHNYRRLIVRHYKILYRISVNKIIINRIFNCRQNPEKLEKM